MKINKKTNQDNNINLNKNQIITHENFKELENLNEKMETIKTSNIDYTLDYEVWAKTLIPLKQVWCEIINVPIAFNVIDKLLSDRIVAIVLFEGRLNMFEQDFVKIQKYWESKSKYIASNDIFKLKDIGFYNLRNPEENQISVHVHDHRRSYFITPNRALKILNIDYLILNKLINEGVLRVIIVDMNVYFYSYQVQEIQHILYKKEILHPFQFAKNVGQY